MLGGSEERVLDESVGRGAGSVGDMDVVVKFLVGLIGGVTGAREVMDGGESSEVLHRRSLSFFQTSPEKAVIT